MRSLPALLNRTKLSAASALVALAVVAASCGSSATTAAPVDQLAQPSPTATTAAQASPPQGSDPTEQAPTPLAPTTEAEPSPQPTEPAASPQPNPEPVAVPELSWEACGDAECGVLVVPLDHADPAGDTLALAVKRVRATSANPKGSLLVNPGGPGASGVAFLDAFAAAVPQQIRDTFDLVSWDPRGVAESAGLECSVDPAAGLNDVADTRDGIQDDVDEAIADRTSLGQACLDVQPDLLDHVGTVATAADLDLLRRALGDTELNYVGYSYGSRLGAVYATVYPDTVGAMVLDGAFPPDLSSTELALKAADLEAVLERIDHVCDLEATCGVADPGLLATLNKLLSNANTDQPRGTLGLTDRAGLVGATLFAIYVPSAWEPYAESLRRADNGDYSAIRQLAERWYGDGAGGFDPIFVGANAAIMCADAAYAATPATTLVDAEAALQASPTLGEALFGATCVGWPTPGTALPSARLETNANPVLIVGSLYDPATPLRWAERLAQDMESSTLVVSEAEGHTAFARGNACVDSIVVDYLLSRQLPPKPATCAAPSGTLGLRVVAHPDGLEIVEVAPTSPLAGDVVIGDVILSRNGRSLAGQRVLQTTAGEAFQLAVRADRFSSIRILNVVADRKPWHHPN